MVLDGEFGFGEVVAKFFDEDALISSIVIYISEGANDRWQTKGSYVRTTIYPTTQYFEVTKVFLKESTLVFIHRLEKHFL